MSQQTAVDQVDSGLLQVCAQHVQSNVLNVSAKTYAIHVPLVMNSMVTVSFELLLLKKSPWLLAVF